MLFLFFSIQYYQSVYVCKLSAVLTIQISKRSAYSGERRPDFWFLSLLYISEYLFFFYKYFFHRKTLRFVCSFKNIVIFKIWFRDLTCFLLLFFLNQCSATLAILFTTFSFLLLLASHFIILTCT